MLILLVIIIVMAIYIVFAEDIRSVKDRDPAAKNAMEVLLLYPGLHALIAYRIAHALWQWRIPFIPRWIAQAARFWTGIEIHPGAQIGKKLFIDHGMGVVVGETAIIGDNVLLYHGVTLGGSGKETGKRHPTIGDNVVVGTGAKILGNIIIGNNSYVGANAVVIRNVPPNSTVVGIPGRVTKQDGEKFDAALDHTHVNDPVMDNMATLLKRIKKLEERTGCPENHKESDNDFVI